MGRMCGLSTVVTPAGASLTMYREIRSYANSIWDDNNNYKGFSGGIYVDVILVHIKTRLDLLGIQTFRWDQRLGRQYSNLNRHVSTQEKQSQRQHSTSSSMVL